MSARLSPRQGFTFIELLIVVSIIAALAGISLAGLSILRRQAKIASTLSLMTDITKALDVYITEYRKLGNDSNANDFLTDPWKFLHKDLREHHKPPLLELHLERLVQRVSAGSCKRPDAVHTATHITDFFGSMPGNVLSFGIYNNNLGSNPNTQYVHCIILRSSAGTLGEPKDDLFYAYSADKASWRKLKYDDVDDFLAELNPVPAPPYSMNWVDPLSY